MHKGLKIMNKVLHSRYISSISELKKNPMGVVENGGGEAVAILNRNTPVFYCVPPEMYEKMIDLLKDQEAKNNTK